MSFTDISGLPPREYWRSGSTKVWNNGVADGATVSCPKLKRRVSARTQTDAAANAKALSAVRAMTLMQPYVMAARLSLSASLSHRSPFLRPRAESCVAATGVTRHAASARNLHFEHCAYLAAAPGALRRNDRCLLSQQRICLDSLWRYRTGARMRVVMKQGVIAALHIQAVCASDPCEVTFAVVRRVAAELFLTHWPSLMRADQVVWRTHACGDRVRELEVMARAGDPEKQNC